MVQVLPSAVLLVILLKGCIADDSGHGGRGNFRSHGGRGFWGHNGPMRPHGPPFASSSEEDSAELPYAREGTEEPQEGNTEVPPLIELPDGAPWTHLTLTFTQPEWEHTEEPEEQASVQTTAHRRMTTHPTSADGESSRLQEYENGSWRYALRMAWHQPIDGHHKKHSLLMIILPVVIPLMLIPPLVILVVCCIRRKRRAAKPNVNQTTAEVQDPPPDYKLAVYVQCETVKSGDGFAPPDYFTVTQNKDGAPDLSAIQNPIYHFNSCEKYNIDA